MEDLKRTARVLYEVTFIAGVGAGLVILFLGVFGFLTGIQINDFLFESRAGMAVLIAAALVALSFIIQEGHFSDYKKRYERNKEKWLK